jgi:tight adherence protein C
VTMVAVMSVVLAAAAILLAGRAVVLPRLRAARHLHAIDAYGFSAPDLDIPVVEEPNRPFESLARRIGAPIAARMPAAKADNLRRILRAAGHYTAPIEVFQGYRVLACAGVMALFGLILIPGSMPTPIKLLALMYAFFAGWRAPLFVISKRGTARMDEIERQLPDMIELLVITVEAGLGFSSSLRLATGRIDGALGDELRLSLQEQDLGVDLQEALHHMLERADTAAMRSFVRTIDQGQSMGVSIGTILRNLSVEMRKRRRQRIEERAQKAPIKILFPLVFMIFPALLLIAGFPIVQSLHETFSSF